MRSLTVVNIDMCAFLGVFTSNMKVSPHVTAVTVETGAFTPVMPMVQSASTWRWSRISALSCEGRFAPVCIAQHELVSLHELCM